MIKNSAVIYINGINMTAFTVTPLKWANLLDERLDEMFLGLRRCPFEVFKPLTPVEIHFSNELYFNSTVDTQTDIKRYIVATDENATENPTGSGFYDHDLYIIELTKYLERIIVDTSTITNDLGRNYTKNAKSAPLVTTFEDGTEGEKFSPQTPSTFTSPVLVGSFNLPSAYTIFPYHQGYSQVQSLNTYIQTVTDNLGTQLFTNTYQLRLFGNDITGSIGENIGYNLNLESGKTYTVFYSFEYLDRNSSPSGYGNFTNTATYTFLAVENQYPLKRWTITDVINRMCDIAEPIRKGETPRFQLNAEQSTMFDNVLAPQFSFTKSTFRECLQQCGKIVHGEPRLDIATNADGSFYYEISFELYGQTEQSNINIVPYISKTVSQVVESYASQVDSSAENLVNQLDRYSGVITEPYSGGYKTVRTETVYVRITDENMIIPTQFPIYALDEEEGLICGYIPGKEDLGQNFNLTPYVFEASVYNTRLSSYSSLYPTSKAYGLSYTQGQKNITALNFKPENPISSVFENYSIINILSAVTNTSVDTLTSNINYPLLAFRVKYTPFYNSRVGQTKLNYQDYPYPAALNYNQQANVIEAKYYGENLKGTIARIGNVEKSITYNLARLSEIPSAGQMFDADYYISAVTVEFLPTYIKCTLGLSKDFNRLSQYIGISSVKRFSEVSQGQSVERNTLWKEYIVVGDEMTPDTDCYTGGTLLRCVSNAFLQNQTYTPPTNVAAWGTSYDGNTMPVVYLPVIASAFGNSIAFSWSYEDNYSAGAFASRQEGDGSYSSVSGYFQNNYQYTDYYGKIYYYNFDLQQAGPQMISPATQNLYATDLPDGAIPDEASGYVSTVGQQPIILRKDNREKLQCNFQIDFVSNRPGLIIGSALAAYCSAVRPPDLTLRAKLYVFDQPLNKFIDHVSGSINVDISQLPSQNIAIGYYSSSNGKFNVSPPDFATSGVAWAICTQQTTVTETVEDEEGNITTQTTQKGGDVLLAQNMNIQAGDAFPTVYFTIKRDIFDRSCWVANL